MSDNSPAAQPLRDVLARYWIGIAVMLTAVFWAGLGYGYLEGMKSATEFSLLKVLAIGGVVCFVDSHMTGVVVVGNNAIVHFDGQKSIVPSSMRIDYVDIKTKKLVKSEVIVVQGIPKGKPRIDVKTPEHQVLILLEIHRN